jgi:hypothetical protein
MSFDFITFIRDKTGFGAEDYALDVRAVQPVGGTSYITINGEPVVTGAPYQATYYKSVVQNLTSGNTDITFDLDGSWNNTGGYITTDTTNFNVGVTGLYQLEFNATILANGATWGITGNKNIAIDITRTPIAEQTIIANSALQASGQNYAQCVTATCYLEAGDVINLRIGNTFAGGPARVQCLQNTFDLNTFFTWRFIS